VSPLRAFLRTVLMTALVVTQTVLSPSAQAAPGDPDPTFGIGGKVTTDFALNGFSDDDGNAMALQPDGKIVVAGTGFFVAAGPAPGQDFVLARYNPTGSLDPTFGTGGKVTTSFGGKPSRGQDMVLQPDGRIVVAGVTFTGTDADFNVDFAMARYNPDGTLDTAFGTGGKVVTDFSRADFAEAVALQPDGKIVVAGNTILSGSGFQWTLARYNPDGSLDTSFGTGGKVTTNFTEGLIDLALQPDGKIVAAGESSSFDFALARYNLDGFLDSSFGAGGKVSTDRGGEDAIFAIALQPDGRIVAAGISIFFGPPVTVAFQLARYNPDGTLDGTFGSSGTVTTNFGGTNEAAIAVVLQPDGRIVAAGHAGTTAASEDFALARYNPDGSLDTSFGSGGKVTTDFVGNSDASTALALQPDGMIVAAGIGLTARGEDFALARYEGGAVITVPIDIKPGSTTNPIKLSSSGRIPVAIFSTSSFDATTVDPTSVCFGDAEATAQRACTATHSNLGDVNGDGRLDLLLLFETRQTSIDPGDTQACLTGGTFSGLGVEGCDSIKTL
jgi:uncharacterized delta-60 repeat protein